MGKRKTKGNTIGEILIRIVLVLICVVTLYPFMYVLAYSFSSNLATMTRTVTFYPIDFTLDNYQVVFANRQIIHSFLISVGRTVCGVLYALAVTSIAAWAMSKRHMPGNRFLSLFFIIPMYVTGGLIPYYVVISKLGLFNNFLVYILPQGFWTFNMLLMRTFFEGLPSSMEEAAKIDGASEWMTFLRIIMPLSMPIVVTIVMYVGVWQWNAFLDSMMYVTQEKLLPMQSLLQRLLLESFSNNLEAQARQVQSVSTTSPEALKMASVVVTTLPILFVYPFLQKYFIKGMMLGAVKA